MPSHLLTEALLPQPWGDERRKQEKEEGNELRGGRGTWGNQGLKFQGSLLAQGQLQEEREAQNNRCQT